MPRPISASLLASALLAAGLGPARATEVLLPRNDKVEAPHAGKGFGKESSTALPVVAMAVRPVPEPAPEPAPPAPTFTGGGELGFAAASGSSHAPGTRTTSTTASATPWSAKALRAPATSASVMRGFQRLARIAKRAPSRARRSPS